MILSPALSSQLAIYLILQHLYLPNTVHRTIKCLPY